MPTGITTPWVCATRGKWSDRFEGLRAGIVLHRLAGIARPEIVQLEHEAKSGRILGEVAWHDKPGLHEQERAMIARALERFRGNRREAAEALKISTVTLWRKVKQYGLGS